MKTYAALSKHLPLPLVKMSPSPRGADAQRNRRRSPRPLLFRLEVPVTCPQAREALTAEGPLSSASITHLECGVL